MGVRGRGMKESVGNGGNTCKCVWERHMQIVGVTKMQIIRNFVKILEI